MAVFFNYVYKEHEMKIKRSLWAQKKQYELMHCNNNLYVRSKVSVKS